MSQLQEAVEEAKKRREDYYEAVMLVPSEAPIPPSLKEARLCELKVT